MLSSSRRNFEVYYIIFVILFFHCINKVGQGIMQLHRAVKRKLCMFQSFIMSYFHFCPLVWHFCGVQDLKKIEKIEIRAYATCTLILRLVMHH